MEGGVTMAIILNPGQRMYLGEARGSEHGRFELELLADGNLAIFAYVSKPEEKRQPIKIFYTQDHYHPELQLHMNPGGWLELRYPVKGTWHTSWTLPGTRRPSGIPDNRQPKSAAWLTENGELQLRLNPEVPWFRTGGVDAQTNAVTVMPGTLTVDVSGGSFSSMFDKHVENNSPEKIGVSDGKEYVILKPGEQVAVTTPGTLAVGTQVYFLPAGQTPGEQLWPRREYGRDEHVISVEGTGASGFTLTT
jgi:hypothetical protein